MKTKLVIGICAAALLLTSAPSALAEEDQPLAVAADTLVVRPVCLAATVVGSAVFVVSLPVAALSKSVKQSAKTLVVKPAQATFTRPLGDMDALRSGY